MTPDRRLWAEALMIEREHGDRAPIFIAEQMRALVLSGDADGVERLKMIAVRLEQLRPARQFPSG